MLFKKKVKDFITIRHRVSFWNALILTLICLSSKKGRDYLGIVSFCRLPKESGSPGLDCLAQNTFYLALTFI